MSRHDKCYAAKNDGRMVYADILVLAYFIWRDMALFRGLSHLHLLHAAPGYAT